MSDDRELLGRLEELAEGGRHPVDAYLWVLRVIDEVRRRLNREGHIVAAELLEGHRQLALREFGPMAYEVLLHWNVESSKDIGRLVWDLIEADLLRKTDDDQLEDFDGGYDFREVFVERYPW